MLVFHQVDEDRVEITSRANLQNYPAQTKLQIQLSVAQSDVYVTDTLRACKSVKLAGFSQYLNVWIYQPIGRQLTLIGAANNICKFSPGLQST